VDAANGSRLGLCPEPAAPPSAEASLRAAPGRGPRLGRILVMDDNRMVRETMRRQLVVFGYEVELAAEGREAVAAYEQARGEGKPFDMVVLDQHVDSGWNGERALHELKRLDPGVRTMVCSGLLDAPHETYVRKGFGCVLPKPYSLGELRLKLAELLSP
jgi:two-component system, cell cycle sensor histidine kinase and response regulator CckA